MSWLDRLFGKSKTRSHYEREADKAARQFVDHYPDENPDFVDDEIDENPDFVDRHGSPDDAVEFISAEGESEDIDWVSFDHVTGEARVQFLEHGKPGRLYRYWGLERQDILDLIDGPGPFPSGRDPHYLKAVSSGQNANFYLRNDQLDDGVHAASGSRFTYERIG